MALSFKHLFASSKGDPADATLIKPSNWNAEHVLTAAANVVVGRGGDWRGRYRRCRPSRSYMAQYHCATSQ